MSFLLFLILVALGFTLFCLWRISSSLAMIAACIGFDEMKKAGVLDEMRASTLATLRDTGAMREIIASGKQQVADALKDAGFTDKVRVAAAQEGLAQTLNNLT